ncbi:MAG: DUF4347 domain-containing protein, partial [Leptolyngbyaceae cyanobacterium]
MNTGAIAKLAAAIQVVSGRTASAQKVLMLGLALIVFGLGLLLPPHPTEIVLIDAAVSNPEYFLQHLHPHQHGIVLSPHSTLVSATQQLQRFQPVQAIHVIAHGTPGQLQIGQTVINHASLIPALSEHPDASPQNASPRDLLTQWGQVLAPGGDLVLYSCELAATPAGENFLETLHQITQADIAASIDLSGSPALNGNWELEATVGTVSSALSLGNDYGHVLRQMTVTHSADRGEGTLRWAIAQANLTPEDDLIELRGLSAPIVLQSPLPTIHSNLYLFGHGATVSGHEQFRVLQVQDSTLVVRDLTIADGLARGPDGDQTAGGNAGLGGGLLIDQAGVTLSQVKLVNNRAEGGNGSQRSQPAIPFERSGVIENEKTSYRVNRGALTGINGISLPMDENADLDLGALTITGTGEKFSDNRGAIAGVNGNGVGGIGRIALGGGGGCGGFGGAGKGGGGG